MFDQVFFLLPFYVLSFEFLLNLFYHKNLMCNSHALNHKNSKISNIQLALELKRIDGEKILIFNANPPACTYLGNLFQINELNP